MPINFAKDEAKYFLEKYKTSLENLNHLIQMHIKKIQVINHYDKVYVPNLINIIEAISNGKETATVTGFDMDRMPFKTECNPLEFLANYATNQNKDKIPTFPSFEKIIDFHLNKPENAGLFNTITECQKIIQNKYNNYASQEATIAAQKQIEKESNSVTIYKAKNGELAVKFPTKEAADTFIEKMGGQIRFPSNDQFNAGKKFLERYDNNPTTFYIPSYKAKNGELAASFPSSEAMNKFHNLVIKSPGYDENEKNNQNKFSSGIINNSQTPTIRDNKVIYFKDKSLHTPGNNIKLNLTDEMKSRQEVTGNHKAR